VYVVALQTLRVQQEEGCNKRAFQKIVEAGIFGVLATLVEGGRLALSRLVATIRCWNSHEFKARR
jgi:hypothetical protein